LKIEFRGGKSSFKALGADWTKVRYTNINRTCRAKKSKMTKFQSHLLEEENVVESPVLG